LSVAVNVLMFQSRFISYNFGSILNILVTQNLSPIWIPAFGN